MVEFTRRRSDSHYVPIGVWVAGPGPGHGPDGPIPVPVTTRRLSTSMMFWIRMEAVGMRALRRPVFSNTAFRKVGATSA